MKTRLISARMRESAEGNIILIGRENYTVLKKIGEGGFSRVYEALASDKKVRAVKMINIIGMNGEINNDEIKEINLLQSLSDVPEVAKLIHHEIQCSQEGVLLVLVMEKGETNLSQILKNIKMLSIPMLLFFWESMLECISALHQR